MQNLNTGGALCKPDGEAGEETGGNGMRRDDDGGGMTKKKLLHCLGR